MSAPPARNLHQGTVSGFGEEWTTFDYSNHSPEELEELFAAYFGLVDFKSLPASSVALDVGCGTGRWARLVAPLVGHLHCVDASADALAVARRNLSGAPNCSFHHASVDELPVPDASIDFAYSLGVLHHVPDTAAAVAACVGKLRRGAPFLLYLYYAFDNRPAWFRTLWSASDLGRRVISRLPFPLRFAASQAIAASTYWPLARTASVLERIGFPVESLPLSAYRHRSFYVMRTDALDRFGTKLEQRFTRAEILAMMTNAGLERIQFSDAVPFWTAIGYRK